MYNRQLRKNWVKQRKDLNKNERHFSYISESDVNSQK